jgi:DNA-binding response OmpR family regulator
MVDDDDDMREMTAELLSDAGYNVRDFADGAAAWEYLIAARHLPSLVMTDWVMPQMNGSQLVAAMQAHPRLSAIPVLVLTGTKDVAYQRTAVVMKPVDGNALLAKIALLLTGSPKLTSKGS